MKEYLELGEKILNEGSYRVGRGDIGTHSLFGHQLRFNLMEGFPILSTQAIDVIPLAAELFWFLAGDTNNENLIELGAKFWTPWALKEAHQITKSRSGYDQACDLANRLNIIPREVINRLNSMSPTEARKFLDENGVSENEVVDVFSKGELGPIYGKMWRDFGGVDQIHDLLMNLQNLPYSRRHVISGWNPTLLPDETKPHTENILAGKQCLPPCHALWQVYVTPITKKQIFDYLKYQIEVADSPDEALMYRGEIAAINSFSFENDEDLIEFLEEHNLPTKRLSLQLYARSQDYPVGTPVNIASYALLTHLLALTINAVPGEYIHTMGDVHIYDNQVEKFKEQLQREFKKKPYLKFPKSYYEHDWKFEISNRVSLFHRDPNYVYKEPHSKYGFKPEDITLVGYDPHPRITYKVLV